MALRAGRMPGKRPSRSLEQYVFSAETRTELEAGAKLRPPPSTRQAPTTSSTTRERCDLSDLPEDVQDALTRHANQLAPNCTMRSVERIFDGVISVYCVTRGWYCPLHKRTHDSNNFCLWFSVQFQDIVFLREKGPKYAVPTAAGSYDLYAGQHTRLTSACNIGHGRPK